MEKEKKDKETKEKTEKKNKETNEKFEKRRKGVAFLLKINIAIVIVDLLITIIAPANFIMFDQSTYIIKDIVSLVLAFLAIKSAEEAKISAGIIGILFAIIDLTGGFIIFAIGLLLLIDSILYIKDYPKK